MSSDTDPDDKEQFLRHIEVTQGPEMAAKYRALNDLSVGALKNQNGEIVFLVCSQHGEMFSYRP